MKDQSMRSSTERGIALITTMLVMALMSALLIGFTAIVMSDQRYRYIDRNRSQAFYAASGGVEKLTADLGNLFQANVAPTGAQVTALTASTAVPSIEGVQFTAPIAPDPLPLSSLSKCASPNTLRTVGTNGYTIKFCGSPTGNPVATSTTPIKTGPYEGLVAQQTPYQIDVTARTASGGEVHLVRTIESVAIPVFQFGMFSDVDLSFSAADDFDWSGRVHTNGNLFLANGNGNTLTLRDKVTAVKEIVRQRLSNGVSIDTVSQTGTVKMAKAPGSFTNMLRTWGSVVDGIGSAENEPLWHTTSLSTYASWIRNGRTGAKTLALPLITVGGSNPDLIRRPVEDEDEDKPALYAERLYRKASLRVLLSDTAADIMNLPDIDDSADPVKLDDNWRVAAERPVGYGPADATDPLDAAHPPIARSPGLQTAVITGGANSGTGRTLTIAAGVPAFLRAPATLVVTKTGTGAGTWTVTDCSTQKTATVFTCTPYSSIPAHTANTTATNATVTATINRNGESITVSSPLNAQWNANSGTITVQSTMAFAPESFWVDGKLVSCSGYTATTLTGCNLPANISNNSTLTTSAHSTVGTGTIGGYVKIERQNTNGSWTDVTMEFLNHGIAGPNLGPFGGANSGGTACSDPTPNAILRIQRLRDNNWTTCTYGGLNVNTFSTDFWPNVLFDAREAVQRDSNYPGANLTLGGIVHYITIDAANLSKWFRKTAPYNTGTGDLAKTDNGGYTVYFSDRRNNRNAGSQETGEYGWEDFVNPGVANGVPNGTLQAGEDLNVNTTLDVYGGVPNYNGTYNSLPPGATNPFATSMRPTSPLNRGQAQVNRAVIFRRALKLINGATLYDQLNPATGLTIVSENPVYIQGNWNANGAFTGNHLATAVIADAVTVLSNNWSDNNSFAFPYDVGTSSNPTRPRSTDSYYRVAIISGKNMIFQRPSDVATGSTFGTDGGAHSFLRMLEGGSGTTVHYKGSMATFFYARQAVGPFKCCGGVVYSVPTRDFTFDTDFLSPDKLPPNTPVFRDMNAVGFAQEMRPGR